MSGLKTAGPGITRFSADQRKPRPDDLNVYHDPGLQRDRAARSMRFLSKELLSLRAPARTLNQAHRRAFRSRRSREAYEVGYRKKSLLRRPASDPA